MAGWRAPFYMGRPGTGVCRASWCAIAPTKQSRSSLSTAGLVSGSKHGSTLSLEPLLVRSSRRLLLHLPPMCLAVRQCVLSPASSGMRQKYAQTCSSMLSGTGRATATSSSAATDMALATMPSALSPVHAPARIFAQVTWADRDEVGNHGPGSLFKFTKMSRTKQRKKTAISCQAVL